MGLGVALQPDGKIVVAGYSGGDFALIRFNPAGSLDTSLKGSGVVTNALNIYPEALVLQPDGKIVVAGYTVEATSNAIAVLRYLGDPVMLIYLPVILKE